MTANLKVLLPVEDDRLGLDLAILDVDLVADEHNGNILTHPDQIAMPVGYVFVCDTRGYVKHHNGTLTCNVYQ